MQILSKGNYRLLLMSDETEKLNTLSKEIGKSIAEVEVISCAKEACWEADVIIIASPYNEERKVAEKIQEVAIGKIVIRVSYPLDQDYEKLFPSNSAAEELQHLLPYSKVVMTFNTASIENFVTDQPADTFIAGNNSDAIETVSQMVKEAGYKPFVVGDLSVSRGLELLLAQKLNGQKFNWNMN